MLHLSIESDLRSSVDDDLSTLPETSLLRQLLATRMTTDAEGRAIRISSGINIANAMALYRQIRIHQPTLVVEIGMAYGVSTLAILTALAENGIGELTSIDPYPGWESAREVAVSQIRRASLEHIHTHFHARSEIAMPNLWQAGVEADLVYIDGHHGFGHAFIDMFYAHRLLRIGGLMAFNDCAWRSVHKVIRYVQTHLNYEEVNVGLPQRYRGRNVFNVLVHRMARRSALDRYFKKNADVDPAPEFFRCF